MFGGRVGMGWKRTYLKMTITIGRAIEVLYTTKHLVKKEQNRKYILEKVGRMKHPTRWID